MTSSEFFPMDAEERRYVALLTEHPDDEQSKVNLEQYLASRKPESVVRRLLQFEREILEAFPDRRAIGRLVDDYNEFRVAAYDFLWDHRGSLDFLYRPFDLWLVAFEPLRRGAVQQALTYSQRQLSPVDLDVLPAIVLQSKRLLAAWEAKEDILTFVKRYRGPKGSEPEVQEHEIDLVVAPSGLKPAALKKMPNARG
jgi:hypothetical protein